MSYQGVFENILRVASIVSVNYEQQECTVRMYDRVDDKLLSVPLPQPAAGTDSGVYINPEPGSLVLIGWGFRERPFIVSSLPNNAFSRDITASGNTFNINRSYTGYPYLYAGEVAMAGKKGSQILLNNLGCIDVMFGLSKIQMDSSNRYVASMYEQDVYLESSSSVSGPVERDMRVNTGKEEETENKQESISYFRVLSQIGRDPAFSPVRFTTNLGTPLESIRNPAFVERKEIVYEFAKSYGVGTVKEEIDRYKEDEDHSWIFQPNRRDATKYDVLNLNVDNPNSLIEKVEGTLIDIYGNVLDLNRNVIGFPDENNRRNGDQRIPQISALIRRSIKLHYEINSKKESLGEVAVDVLDGNDVAIGASHSRWSVDVDGEGLTKINIPASSNVGNIPLLTRYINEHQKNKTNSASFKAPSKQDVLHLGFGHKKSDGVSISPSSYAPSTIKSKSSDEDKRIFYKTAYHDIVFTASKALVATGGSNITPALPPLFNATVGVEVTGNSNTGDGNGDASELNNLSTAGESFPGPSAATPKAENDPVPALLQYLVNALPGDPQSNESNAGGRSIHMNLDGSMELNIGRDVVDGKSIVLDTSGGIVSRIGRTKSTSHSASIISQLDGSIFVQIGGDAIESEEELDDPVVKIAIKGSKGVDEFVVDKNAIKLKAARGGGGNKNIVLDSAGNIVLKAKGMVLLAGNQVGVHGTSDDDGNSPAPKRQILQKGKEI